MTKNKKRKQMVFQPEIDTGIKSPVRVHVAVGNVNDKYSQYPSNGLTPKRLASIFRDADEGNVRRQMELFEEMEEKDPHLFSQIQTRKLAVAGLDWEIQPFSEEERNKQIAVFVNEQLRGIENFDSVLIDMLDAIGKGMSVMELEWSVDENGRNVIDDMEYVHPKTLYWDPLTDELKLCTKEYPAGISLPKNKFVIHRYKAKSGHASRAGILRVVAWMYLFKNYDIKDWVSFCEVFGMPLRLGKYDASASEEDRKQLMEAIVSLGTDAAGIVPNTTMIEFIESQKTTSVEIYEKLARYADEQISKAILGQTLTADSGGGSYAQSKTHDGVRHDLTVADAKSLAVTIRRDIITPLVEYNFGAGTDIPFFDFDCQEVDDQKETVDIYKTLTCDMGLEIPKSHVYKKFNIPKPENGEAVLEPQLYSRISSFGSEEIPNMNESGTLSLKRTMESSEQEQLDKMVAMTNQQSGRLFEEMMKPIFKIIDKSKGLEELQMTLKNKNTLLQLYEEMNQPDFEDLLHQSIYLSKLIGRTMMDGD